MRFQFSFFRECSSLPLVSRHMTRAALAASAVTPLPSVGPNARILQYFGRDTATTWPMIRLQQIHRIPAGFVLAKARAADNREAALGGSLLKIPRAAGVICFLRSRLVQIDFDHYDITGKYRGERPAWCNPWPPEAVVDCATIRGIQRVRASSFC